MEWAIGLMILIVVLGLIVVGLVMAPGGIRKTRPPNSIMGGIGGVLIVFGVLGLMVAVAEESSGIGAWALIVAGCVVSGLGAIADILLRIEHRLLNGRVDAIVSESRASRKDLTTCQECGTEFRLDPETHLAEQGCPVCRRPVLGSPGSPGTSRPPERKIRSAPQAHRRRAGPSGSRPRPEPE